MCLFKCIVSYTDRHLALRSLVVVCKIPMAALSSLVKVGFSLFLSLNLLMTFSAPFTLFLLLVLVLAWTRDAGETLPLLILKIIQLIYLYILLKFSFDHQESRSSVVKTKRFLFNVNRKKCESLILILNVLVLIFVFFIYKIINKFPIQRPWNLWGFLVDGQIFTFCGRRREII